MGTNQFRTGNLVQDHDGNIVVINKIDDNIPLVEGVLLNKPNTTHSFRGEAIQNIGIPLKGFPLSRFGFVLDELFEDARPVYLLPDGDFYIEYDTLQPNDSGFDLVSYKIEFVHELQNIYRWVKGKELELK